MTKQKHILIIFLLFLTFKGYSQSKIGVIKDKDGFTNIRSDKSNKSEVIGKIIDKEYFTYFEIDNSNWWVIETNNGQIGYLHKSRVSFVKNGYLKNDKLTNKNVNLTAKEEQLKEVTIKFFQLRPTEDFYDFSCRGLVRTIKANCIIDEINYKNIEPVGSNYGITFSSKQEKENIFIASKFGGYDGEIIIINENGIIQKFHGGQYFVTKNGKYLISPWYSDLSGLTIYDLEKKEVCLSEALDFNLGSWYFSDKIYFSPLWNGEKETEQTYQLDFDNFKLKKSNLKTKEGIEIQMKNKYCDCE